MPEFIEALILLGLAAIVLAAGRAVARRYRNGRRT